MDLNAAKVSAAMESVEGLHAETIDLPLKLPPGPAQSAAGKASEYNKIFEANRDKLTDPDKIHAGQELVIP